MTKNTFPTKEEYAEWVMANPLLRSIVLRGLHDVCRQLVVGKKHGGCYPFADDFEAGKEYTALNLCGLSQKGTRTPEEGQLNVYMTTGFAGCPFNHYVLELGHDYKKIDRAEYQLALVALLKSDYVADAIEYAEEHALYQTDKA